MTSLISICDAVTKFRTSQVSTVLPCANWVDLSILDSLYWQQKMIYVAFRPFLKWLGSKGKYRSNTAPWIGQSVVARVVVNLNRAAAMRHCVDVMAGGGCESKHSISLRSPFLKKRHSLSNMVSCVLLNDVVTVARITRVKPLNRKCIPFFCEITSYHLNSQWQLTKGTSLL